jgi:hypothetical protein
MTPYAISILATSAFILVVFLITYPIPKLQECSVIKWWYGLDENAKNRVLGSGILILGAAASGIIKFSGQSDTENAWAYLWQSDLVTAFAGALGAVFISWGYKKVIPSEPKVCNNKNEKESCDE